MALKFSQGLLSSLGSYGQGGGVGIPTDPRQRNLLQQVGVTNPLLQALGQSLGVATQNLEAGKGRVDFGSAQDKMLAAMKAARDGGLKEKEEAVKVAQAAGYEQQAARLQGEIDLAKQQEAAMIQLNKAAEEGLIDTDERDQVTIGIANKTLDPRAALSLVQQRREKEAAKEEQKANAFKTLDAYAQRGAFTEDELEGIKGDIDGGALVASQIGAMGRANLDKKRKREQLLDTANAVKAPDWVKEAIQDGTITTAQQVASLSKKDKKSGDTVPSSMIAFFQDRADKGDARAIARLEQIQENDGVMSATSIESMYRLMNDIKRETANLEKEQAKEARRIEKLRTGNLSSEDKENYRIAIRGNEELKKEVLDTLRKPPMKLFGVELGERDVEEDQVDAFIIKAARNFPTLSEEQAVIEQLKIEKAKKQAIENGQPIPEAAQPQVAQPQGGTVIRYGADGKRIN